MIPTDYGVDVIIKEKGTGEYFENYDRESVFNLPKVTKPVDKRLNFSVFDVDLEVNEFNRDEFLFAAKTLLSKIDTSDINTPSNYLFFDKENVYCVTQSMVSVLKNTVYENIEREFSILGKVVDSLVKMLDSTEDSIGIVFQENLLLFKTTNYIIVYNIPQMRSQKMVLQKLLSSEWQKAFANDNVLLNAVIKRAGIMGEKLEFIINPQISEVEIKTTNNKFKHSLNLVKSNITENESFSLNIKILENAILKNETYIIIRIGDGRLKVMDTTGLWSSFINFEKSLSG